MPLLQWKYLICSPHLKHFAAADAAKSLQLCPTLCDPIDGSPPDSSIPGIVQARTPEWVAISFSNAWKWKVKVKSFSHVWLFVTPWTAATRLLHPWYFPGKNTEVKHFALSSKSNFYCTSCDEGMELPVRDIFCLFLPHMPSLMNIHYYELSFHPFWVLSVSSSCFLFI